jgi:hypothetical protein
MRIADSAGPLVAAKEAHETPSHRASRRGLGGAVFLVAAVALQLLRQPGTPIWRTVWAEDGAEFYMKAVQQPLRQSILRDYAGYAHVLPRAIAALGTHLPLAWYSAYIAIVTTLIVALLSLFVYYASASLLRSPLRQAILAGSMLVLPTLPFEVLGSISNLQWMFVLPCLFAVLVPVARLRSMVPYFIVAVIAPLTSPLCLLFVPIALFRVGRHFWLRTPRVDLLVPVTYLLAGAVQAAVVLMGHTPQQARPPLGVLARDVSRLYATSVTTDFALGVRVTTSLWDSTGYWLVAVTFAVLAFSIAWKLWRSTAAARGGILILTIASAASFAIEWAQRGSIIRGVVNQSSHPYNFGASRFGLFPMFALLLALLIPNDLPRGAVFGAAPVEAVRLVDDVRRNSCLVAVTALWIAIAIVPSYRFTTDRSSAPDFVHEVNASERACAEPVPVAKQIGISPNGVFIGLDCDQIRTLTSGP